MLWWLAMGCTYRFTGRSFGVAAPTVCVRVHQVQAMHDVCVPRFISFPTSAQLERVGGAATFHGSALKAARLADRILPAAATAQNVG